MTAAILAPLLLAAAAPLAQQSTQPRLPVCRPKVAALRDDALANDHYAWDITEGLTTEVGQRLAGDRSRGPRPRLGGARLKAMGFANVHVEPFTMPVWTRGAESAEIVSPFPQKLVVAALGNSASTGPGGSHRRNRRFRQRRCARKPRPTARSKARSSSSITHDADAGRLGLRRVRRAAAPGPDDRFARKARLAIVIRSIGTDHHRNPHTGVQYFTRRREADPRWRAHRARRRAAGPRS